MKKQLFLSLALLTIGSALQAKSFGRGFAAGAFTGLGVSTIANSRNRDQVVYVKDSSDSNGTSKKHLHKRLKEQEKRIKRLEKQLAKQNAASAA